jgi:flagellar P-ring protein precursor FlgI
MRIHHHIPHPLRATAAGLLLACILPAIASAQTARLKDIARIDGASSVSLIGYGIVVGLSGTGDKDLALTKQTMANLMQSFNISIPTKDIKSKNVAAVIITAQLPPTHRAGDRCDIQVSSIGDSLSLQGGILLMTPMLNADGKLYALAQGSLVLGGYTVGQPGPGGETETKNATTVGLIPKGGLVKESRDLDAVRRDNTLTLVLNHADFTTASRVAEAINSKQPGLAVARNAATIQVSIPPAFIDAGQIADFIASIETLPVVPDNRSRIIVNERTGTIVMGADVHLSAAVVAHGNLTVRIGSTLSTYMPKPLTSAQPVVTEQITVQKDEEKAKMILIPSTVTVRDLADSLNQLGASPRDLISILEALQTLGALQMELVTM